MGEIFLTREETARALRLSLRTIDGLIGQGEIAVRRIGRRVLVPTEEVKRFANVAHHRTAPLVNTSPAQPEK
jgi:excisionase family DNA binding protein